MSNLTYIFKWILAFFWGGVYGPKLTLPAYVLVRTRTFSYPVYRFTPPGCVMVRAMGVYDDMV